MNQLPTEHPWGPQTPRRSEVDAANDLALARVLARKLGLPHTLTFSTPDAVCDYVRGLIKQYESELAELRKLVNGDENRSEQQLGSRD